MKPQVTWTRIPAAPATAAAGGRRAPPGACRVRGPRGEPGGGAVVSRGHLTPAVGPAEGAGRSCAHPPSALPPARGTQLAPAEVAAWSVADLQGDVCMSHHPGPCHADGSGGGGGVGINRALSRTPSQPRPRLSCTVSPAPSPETGCCPRSDVTAAEPAAPEQRHLRGEVPSGRGVSGKLGSDWERARAWET